MTKEGKAVTTASLIVFLYGLTSFLQFKQFIFPFPLNEIIFFIVILYFTKIHYKESPLTCLLIFLTALCNVLSSEVYWNIFLSTETMLWLSNSIITDIFKLLYQVGIIIWMIVTFIQTGSSENKYYLGLIPISLLITGNFYLNMLVGFSSILFLFIYSIIKIRESPLLYLWILLFILESTKVWSLASFS